VSQKRTPPVQNVCPAARWLQTGSLKSPVSNHQQCLCQAIGPAWGPNHSCAGFDDLPVEGPDTDRVVANAAVTALAGFFGHLGTHPRGSSTCPLYFNEARALTHLKSRQRFDPACRARLKKALPRDLGALDALLGTFDKRSS